VWIPRKFEEIVRREAASRPALVLTGGRQVGKSSLLTRTFPDHHVVSLDLPSEAHDAEHEPSSFLARHPLPLIVDEVQYAPALFRHLKRIIDADRGAHGRVILTGSQKYTLMQRVAESLAGRVSVLELEPLSLAELAEHRDGATIEETILRGGYPELWADRSIDARSFFASYVATYLERDLRSMLRVASLRDFERFLRVAALRSGQVLNKADLARDVGISPSTANEWLSLLEASGIVGLLEPWFSNHTKRMVKSPKLHFRDTGLLAFLLNVRSVEELSLSPLRGALFETATYVELRKQLSVTGEVGSLFYYRDRALEVDFVLFRGGRYRLFECKWAESPGTGDASAMERLTRDLGPALVEERTLVCRTPHERMLGATRVVALDRIGA
jgi:predicted AAA+ superfamily ATPase